LIALIVLTAARANAADPRNIGPRELIITYHTTPAHRAAFRHEFDESTSQWRRWKDEGVLQDYRLAYNRYVDSANWDAAALLSFAGDAGVERWKRQIERLGRRVESGLHLLNNLSDGLQERLSRRR
jgi:hypothetical protein